MIEVKSDKANLEAFEALKMEKKSRFVLFKIEQNDEVVIEKIGERDSKWADFVALLPKDDARFAVYDFSYTTDEKPPRTVEKLIFVYWSPDEAPSKVRMSSALTKEKFKKGFNGIVKDIQAKGFDDLDFDEVKGRL